MTIALFHVIFWFSGLNLKPSEKCTCLGRMLDTEFFGVGTPGMIVGVMMILFCAVS